jgi:outer membrane protein OmpA-like peptidoglycan-associated protein
MLEMNGLSATRWLGALVGCLFAAQAASSGELSSNDIVNALQGTSKTRSLVATPEPGLDARTQQLIDGLQSATTRQIVVEERKEIAKALDDSKLPKLDLTIPFEFDSADIAPAALPVLDVLGQALKNPALASARFVVGGHTDAKGSDDYNMALSQRRAEAVRHYLQQTYAIDPARLVAIGFGEVQLKDVADPESGENRRVQLVNLGK